MFDGNSYVVPPRPTYAGPCTCVWPAEYARQQVRAKIDQESSAKADAISNPIGAISAALPERFLPGGFQGVHQRMEAAADQAGKKAQGGDSGPLDEFGRPLQRSGTPKFQYPPFGSSGHSAMLSTDSTIAPGRDVTYTQAGPSYGDVSPETERGGEIFAATKSKGTEHIQHARYNPEREDPRVAEERAMRKAQAKGKLAVKFKADPLGRRAKTYFAKSSETKMRELTAYREDVPYLSETSTRAYLGLVDDAVASSHTQTPMEAVSHHELERIARGELAAIEWRFAMKVARFHKRTDILNLFPVKVGQYAELQVNQTPPSHPEGVLKKAGKKVLHTMGFGTGVTGAAHSAKEASAAMPSE
ncbi:hypothetical protein QFC21_004652 [Naganishia friedmannii]|uniref:Uncharacterized protein n=1 Tax=Naganishia friedmannii TaxID=89922 RepID=A0ACC2VG82_9TREE|nr:hypothetical protein QFC21_004652 [Naganishia friedmannii]